jgi:hypothetical protein
MCKCKDISDIDFTFESKIDGKRSILDHFIVSQNLFNDITYYGVLHEGDNFSDHAAVLLQLSLNDTSPLRNQDKCPQSNIRFSWETASNEEINCYKQQLDKTLSNIPIPIEAIECKDFQCTSHNNDIKVYYNNIAKACKDACSMTIPHLKSNSNTHNGIPGWNKHVKKYRDEAIFWHSLWKSADSPRSGVLADIRKKTRARYHYALRYIKKHEDMCRANQMADSISENRSRDFWNEVKKKDDSL